MPQKEVTPPGRCGNRIIPQAKPHFGNIVVEGQIGTMNDKVQEPVGGHGRGDEPGSPATVPSFLAKALDKTIPLWLLFLAVQLVDISWAIFVLLGIEKVRIVPGFTATNPFDLYYFPYTHSLPAFQLFPVRMRSAWMAGVQTKLPPTQRPAMRSRGLGHPCGSHPDGDELKGPEH